MALVRFCWDKTDPTLWVEKTVLDEHDGNDFESEIDFFGPGKTLGPPAGFVLVPDKLEEDAPMPPATR